MDDEKPWSVAARRLQYLFPTASLNQISRHMYYASGERHALILLILSGYPMRSWWLEPLDDISFEESDVKEAWPE